MVKRITNNFYISSQQSIDSGRKTDGSNAPEPTICGLLRISNTITA